jgi:asparagine synthase (glutamine-hydrolysing)
VPDWMRSASLIPLRHLFHVSRYSNKAFGFNTIAWRAAQDPERSDYDSLLPQPRRFREMLGKDFLASLGDYDPFESIRAHYRRSNTDDHVSRMQYADLKAYLPDDILVKVDRASMAHALEVRCPLLDHRVVEYAARIPPSFKLHGSNTKMILKRAIERLIPPQTFDRKKMGFAIPIAKWFQTALKEPCEELFFGAPGGASGMLAKYESRRLWLEHQAGAVDHGTQLWNAMMFELWYQRFIEGKALEVAATDPMKHHRPTTDDTMERAYALTRSR